MWQWYHEICAGRCGELEAWQDWSADVGVERNDGQASLGLLMEPQPISFRYILKPSAHPARLLIPDDPLGLRSVILDDCCFVRTILVITHSFSHDPLSFLQTIPLLDVFSHDPPDFRWLPFICHPVESALCHSLCQMRSPGPCAAWSVRRCTAWSVRISVVYKDL